MSVEKRISTYPNTLRDWNVNRNDLSLISGLFFILPSVTIPTLANLQNFWYWINTLLKSGSIIPLHDIKKFEPKDDEIKQRKSIQDYTIETSKGKYRHAITFFCSEEFAKLINTFSGAKLPVIYYDTNKHIICTSLDGETNFKGFTVSSISVLKTNFASVNGASKKVIEIELEDTEEFNERGVFQKVTWNPELVDRLIINLDVVAFTTSITFRAYLGTESIDDLESDEITIEDASGTITATLLTIADGIYTLSGLSRAPSFGTLQVVSEIYLGRGNYVATSDVVADAYTFEDGDSYEFEDGTTYDFN